MTPNSPTPAGQAMSADTPETRGDALLRQGLTQQAIQAYLDAVTIPAAASLCLKLARCYDRMGNHSEACRWALSLVDANDDYTAWQAGWTLFQRNAERAAWPTARTVKVAIAGSYTTTQLGTMLRLAAARIGIRLDLYESPYGQYQQDIIDPGSPLYRFSPDIVVLAVHEGDVHLAEFSSDPTAEVQAEITRWTTLWNLVTTQSRARIVQHNFALPSDIPAGHLATRLPGSRYMMTQALNMGLGQAAGTAVSIVDCERLSALIGKQRWCDPRYWNMSKQAVALDALPLLAKHTAAVIAADIGLSRKCLVLDLDNTLWGGVIAEDGLAGIRLGHGAEGEAFVAFQEYLLKLKRKGVILAVCSKNNHADAIQPFQQHPEMRMKMQDIALFIANWNSKPENIRTIADTLQIGLDSLVFVDDNPVEREIVRKFLPQVDVLPMPEDPAYYVRTLSQYLLLETASMTAEDSERTTQYQARAQIKALEASANSIEDFYRSLQMQALVTPFEETQLPRIAQLIGKTNQFNLTTRRHGTAQLEAFVRDTTCVHLALRLRDRYADHGLVSVMIARRDGSTLDIDTWLMSCRVIGRTVEATMLEHLCRRALELGCTSIRGTYIPTPKNAMAAEAYPKQGFSRLDTNDGTEIWMYDLQMNGPVTNPFVQSVDSWDPPR